MNAKISLKKRIVSVILTVIMVFSMVPLSVFATNGGEAEVITAGGATTSFLVYADAAGYANRNGGTLKLLDDITVPEFENLDDIPFVTDEFTLDLNGKSINYVDVGSYNYEEEADEEIKGTPGALACPAVYQRRTCNRRFGYEKKEKTFGKQIIRFKTGGRICVRPSVCL